MGITLMDRVARGLLACAVIVVLVTVRVSPVSADVVINGCTIVASPTSTHHTTCPATTALARADLHGLDLSYADLHSSVLDSADLAGARLKHCSCGSLLAPGADLRKVVRRQ